MGLSVVGILIAIAILMSSLILKSVMVVNVPNDETGSVITIDYPHHEIHEGNHYFIRRTYTIADGQNMSFVFINNDSKHTHLVIGVENSVQTYYTLKRNVTVLSNGTEINARNRNGLYSDNPITKFYRSPSGVANGDLMATSRIGNGKTFGGGDRDSNELILETGAFYFLNVTNEGVGTSDIVNVVFDWYEK